LVGEPSKTIVITTETKHGYLINLQKFVHLPVLFTQEVKMKTKIFITFFLTILLLAACTQAIPTSIPWDSNGDGMVTASELKITFSKMHSIVRQIAKTRPSEAKKLETEITAYENTSTYILNITKVRQTSNEILSLAKIINKEQNTKATPSEGINTGGYILIAGAVVILFLIGLSVIPKGRKRVR
jgi:hypothetical protein